MDCILNIEFPGFGHYISRRSITRYSESSIQEVLIVVVALLLLTELELYNISLQALNCDALTLRQTNNAATSSHIR